MNQMSQSAGNVLIDGEEIHWSLRSDGRLRMAGMIIHSGLLGTDLDALKSFELHFSGDVNEAVITNAWRIFSAGVCSGFVVGSDRKSVQIRKALGL